MLAPLGITPALFAPGTGGVPGTTADPLLGGRVRNRIVRYEQAIAATKGFESMVMGLSATEGEAKDWLDCLMYSTVVYGPDAETIWEGALIRVDATFGQEPQSKALDPMANRVRCRYTTRLGTPGTTALVNDTASQAIYGVKDTVLSLPGSTATAALNHATAELARRKNPMAPSTSEVRTGDLGDITVTLYFVGWYDLLRWLLTSNTSTSSTATTTQVQNLITSYNSTNNFFSTDFSNVTASGISDVETIAPDTPVLSKIEALLKQGNSGGQRLAWGIYEGRKLTVKPWAGATPTTTTYQRYLREGVIRDAAGGVVSPWRIRPDAMYQIVDLLDVAAVSTAADESARKYVERVVCSISSGSVGVSLEPQASDALDARLARLR